MIISPGNNYHNDLKYINVTKCDMLIISGFLLCRGLGLTCNYFDVLYPKFTGQINFTSKQYKIPV